MQMGTYQHYKHGNLYQVIDVAIHTETREEMVVYRALYKSDDYDMNQLWVRPKKMFLENMILDGVMTPRFKFIGVSND